MTMTNWVSLPRLITSAFSGARRKRLMALATLAALTLAAPPTLAQDVFRRNEPHKIGENTEAAFKAIFQEGNYRQAEDYLQKAESTEPNEPLVYAMQASFAYSKNFKNKDWNAFKNYSDKTLEVAKQLSRTDALRGNLYTAVGYALEGAYSFTHNGGALGAMSQLQQAFQYLDEAKKISPNDPELNLLKGYMDLILAVNVPFSDPYQAIAELEQYAAPQYVAVRGIAMGYRDLKNYNKAVEYVNKALQETPNNPDLHYLKAQILVAQGKKEKNSSLREEADLEFQTALSKSDQLPRGMVAQMFFEQCNNQHLIDNKEHNCVPRREQITNSNEQWGPKDLP